RVASELSKSAALLASGPISFESVSLGAHIEELEREVARLNDAAAAQSKEVDRFEQALRQVEANYPEVELDRSVFKPPNCSTVKTQPPVAGNGE
ncbi:hypothetical protein A2U01_0016619, partial [Trifolium medium]|nr:hypothetical protein [Trifolium medium]